MQPGEKAELVNLTDEDNAVYVLHFVRVGPDGEILPARSVWFSRINLHLDRLLVYDPAGNILTDARYSDWKDYDGVPFPKTIDITRPQDEYAVVLTVVKMEINRGVSDDKFVLEQPEGTQLQILGQPAPTPPPAPPPPPRGRRNRDGKTRSGKLEAQADAQPVERVPDRCAGDPDSVPGGSQPRHAGRFRPPRPRHRRRHRQYGRPRPPC